MNNFEYRKEIDLTQKVDEIARMVQRRIDQAALDKSTGVLARYGYVKVVRCRDCRRYHDGTCYRPDGDGDYARWAVEPGGFCAWGRTEGGRR